jgi:hypothetical protein
VLGAIYTASLIFHGINSGVISLVAIKFSTILQDYGVALCLSSGIVKVKKVKISLLQAVEAHKVARGQGSHIT